MDKQQARREALAKRVRELHGYRSMEPWGALTVADFIIAEQERREGPLVEVLETISRDCVFWPKGSADAALAAYRALDAPPQRTVEQIAADAERFRKPHEHFQGRSREGVSVFVDLTWLDELAAALKRGKE